ncbi:hypothetical protein BJX76DRAFT_350862 [Aspergillus varians]
MKPDPVAEGSAYSTNQITAWLKHIRLPTAYIEHGLSTLMRCQISRFPYENLSVNYSPTHLVDIRPEVLYEKLMGGKGRGGYCIELSIFFPPHVRSRSRTNGVPGGEYQGFSHINNIVHLPSGDGPTSPLPLDEPGRAIQNLGRQEVRLIYQYRNGSEHEWNSFYSFAGLEFFQHDFEVMNWWTAAKSLHRWTVLVVRFLREGEDVRFSGNPNLPLSNDIKIVGKVMLVDNVVKVNLGGKTNIVHSFDSEKGRLQALRDCFGIILTK